MVVKTVWNFAKNPLALFLEMLIMRYIYPNGLFLFQQKSPAVCSAAIFHGLP